MEIPESLLECLVCPETKQPLCYADQATVEAFNSLVRSRHITDKSGRTLDKEADALLVRQDGAVLYQVRDSIPIMLMEEAVDAAQLS